MLFGSGVIACGGNEIMQENRKSSSERILFEQGTGPGQLFYPADDTAPVLPVPARVAVGTAGEISILEPGVNRIQAFTPEGKFLSALTLTRICESLGMTRQGGTMNLINVFSKEPYVASTLVHLEAAPGGANQYWLVTYRVDTSEIFGHQEISALPDNADWVYMSFLDNEGYLWLFTNQWLVFGSTGKLVAILGAHGSYVDRNGSLYVGGDTVKAMDRSGRTVATLTVEPETGVEIDGGDPETFLFSWEKNLEKARAPQMVTYPNIVNLYQIESKTQRLVLRGRIELPPTKLSYPGPNPDFAVPIECYMNELAVLRGNYFYILAYSKDKYWIDRYDFSPWLRP